MALDPLYIVSSDLESYFVDKDTGLPLANGILYFYRDSARTVPKPVYQLSGAPPNYTYTSMGAQINLSSVGTVQNNGGDNEVIYWYPYDADGNIDLYYVVVQDSGGTVQFTREAWPPNAGNSGSNLNAPQTNQIANPTFTNTFLNPAIPTVYTISSTDPTKFSFAPEWDFIISGTGTVTIQQIAISGNQGVLTSPPYVLDVQVSSGITACYLTQTFSSNSGLWSSTTTSPIYLYGAFLAKNVDSGNATLQMFYQDGIATPILITSNIFPNNFGLQSGVTSSPLPISINPNTGVNGEVKLYLSFDPSSHVQISNVQVIPQFNNSTTLLGYDLDSSNRNQVYQGDYYLPRAAAKQIDSFLTGWDFAVNPYQFGLPANFSNIPSYIADQTIAQSFLSPVSSATFLDGGLRFSPAGANGSFYIMQYLSGDQVKNISRSNLAVNVYGYQHTPPGSSPVTMRVYLFKGTQSNGIPSLVTSPTTIGTINLDGTFELNAAAVTAGWTAVDRGGLPIPQVTLNNTYLTGENDINNDYGFSGWKSNDLGFTNVFAIVVTFSYNYIATIININSISLVPGDLPCRPAVKSAEETLQECQYYYETGNDEFHFQAMNYYGATPGWVMVTSPFTIKYQTIKRAPPTITFGDIPYNIPYQVYSNGSQGANGGVVPETWAVGTLTTAHATYVPATSQVMNIQIAADDRVTGGIFPTYVLDARLGIV